MERYQSEAALLRGFVAAVAALDPDVVVGFDLQRGSLGYLSERAAALVLPSSLLRDISRTPELGSTKDDMVRGMGVGGVGTRGGGGGGAAQRVRRGRGGTRQTHTQHRRRCQQ